MPLCCLGQYNNVMEDNERNLEHEDAFEDVLATDGETESNAVELLIDEGELDAALNAVVEDQSAEVDSAFRRAAAKVRGFPRTPGVYLMKDAAGRVIYVGKAKNLRSRAGSYFLKGALVERRTADWVPEIADIDFVACDSEVDALLMESRLIKDIQPKHNRELKDDKSFPY